MGDVNKLAKNAPPEAGVATYLAACHADSSGANNESFFKQTSVAVNGGPNSSFRLLPPADVISQLLTAYNLWEPRMAGEDGVYAAPEHNRQRPIHAEPAPVHSGDAQR